MRYGARWRTFSTDLCGKKTDLGGSLHHHSLTNLCRMAVLWGTLCDGAGLLGLRGERCGQP